MLKPVFIALLGCSAVYALPALATEAKPTPEVAGPAATDPAANSTTPPAAPAASGAAPAQPAATNTALRVSTAEADAAEAKKQIASLDKAIKARDTASINFALNQLTTMAQAGNADAAFRLAQYYHQESETPNNSRAMAYYEQAAAAGNIRAIANIGQIYRRRGDIKSAMQYFERAAERGDTQAYKILAEIYLIGSEVPKDEAAGLSWMEKGFAANSASTYHFAGDAFFYGYFGLKQDQLKGISYYDRAAELGDFLPKLETARMFIDGRGVEVNTPLGLKMLDDLQTLKVMEASEILGSIYAEGRVNIPSNRATAVKHWQTGAALGSCMSAKNLGVAFDNGWTGQSEPVLAADYIEQAAKCGNNPDPFDLWKAGTRYQYGKGRAITCELAVPYYNKAMQGGYIQAGLDMAAMYESGCGQTFPPSASNALKNYLYVAKSGTASAQFKVGQILAKLLPEPEKYKAYAWLQLAREGGEEAAGPVIDKLLAGMDAPARASAAKHLDTVRPMILGAKGGPGLSDGRY